MKFIERIDLERWAKTYDSKGSLPTLISRLVRATTPPGTQTEFPSGSSAFVGGWDGIVNCPEEKEYVPKGISLWEFGTEEGVKGKADSDYQKRTNNPDGYDPKECTFIFFEFT